MEEKDIGYLIKSINDKLKVKADAELKTYNLTLTQSRVFSYLISQNGVATQKEIETFLDVTHPTVVGIVSRMEQNGYVTCFLSDDKRNKKVKLTEKALEIGLDLRQNMLATEKKLLEPLDEEQKKQLRMMLTAIAENLE